MEPDVIHIYSSSPPPMEDGVEEDEDEFGDFGGFSGVPSCVSFAEFDTPATFNQSVALVATTPPELLTSGRVVGLSSPSPGNCSNNLTDDLSKANGIVQGGCYDDSLSERSVKGELKKQADCSEHSKSFHLSEYGQTYCEPTHYNSIVSEVITNGFSSDVEDKKTSVYYNSIQTDMEEISFEDLHNLPLGTAGVIVEFAALNGHPAQVSNTNENFDIPEMGSTEADNAFKPYCNTEQGITLAGTVRDGHTTSFNHLPDCECNTSEAGNNFSRLKGGFHIDIQLNTENNVAMSHSVPEPVFTKYVDTINKVDLEESEEPNAGMSSGMDGEVGPIDQKGSGNETETETETSLGRQLSADAVEEYSDMSTTGSFPSPPLHEDMATPVDRSQMGEEEDFGHFGNVISLIGQRFVEFDQQMQEHNGSIHPPSEPKGDFDIVHVDVGVIGDDSKFSNFPGSDSFADFSSATMGADKGSDDRWCAFNEAKQDEKEEPWAAFEEVQSVAEKSEGEWLENMGGEAVPTISDQANGKDSHSTSFSTMLGKLLHTSFPETPFSSMVEEVVPLKTLLGPSQRLQQFEVDAICIQNDGSFCDMWRQLQDIHEAFGLRYQWGGSHNNKTLLLSLGIDIRNILFTGQKKQPVIVPMYAASLGMLEPTKEPVKPMSAAEMIASIAQPHPISPKIRTSQDTTQETLPPVQFDWSSSGLTNPLDASGGSSLLNLDFFGPIEDSGSSSSTSIPGVDPELYELTTAKLNTIGSASRVADAFARLMSTMEKTSTSTRKPRREEHLSEEAAKVIAGLPDLSFMQAKVLMFPTTLTPLGCTDPTTN